MLKRIISVLFSAVSVLSFTTVCNAVEASDLSALSSVLYCKETGDVLFEKNSQKQLSMASTTKIMTSLIALEYNTPYREIDITQEMVAVEGTSSGLRAGDRITLLDLVYCMLLESGNDAANSVAIALGGSFDGFSRMMNEKAAQIGMTNTSFVTPSGLDDEKHYTTAYDMALLTAYALDNQDFVKICSQKSYRVYFRNSDKQVVLYNHNRLLKEYEGCIGVKTGFTKKSGRCLVSAAARDGVTIIAVTLNAGDDWNDHKKLLDYGFECIKRTTADTDFSALSVPVVGSDKRCVRISCEKIDLPYYQSKGINITRKIYLEKFLYAPVKKGDVAGFVRYYNNGRLIVQKSLTVTDSADIYETKEKFNFKDFIKSLSDRW